MSAIRPPASPVDPDTDVNAGPPTPVGFDSRTTGDPSKAVAEQEPIVRPRRHPLAPKQYLWIVGALVVLFVALTWLGPVLTPFLIGAILAYLGTPAVARAERRGVPRSLATLFVILFIGLLLAALFLVLIPLVQSEVGSITRKLPDLFAQFTDRVAPFL
jgi:predicted PurR-regulated permease PerM